VLRCISFKVSYLLTKKTSDMLSHYYINPQLMLLASP